MCSQSDDPLASIELDKEDIGDDLDLTFDDDDWDDSDIDDDDFDGDDDDYDDWDSDYADPFFDSAF
jgi:hypothetical protein